MFRFLFGKKAPLIEVEDFVRLRSTGADLCVLDIREPAETRAEPVPGALEIPICGLNRRLAEVPRDKPVIVVCPRQTRSWMAGVLLIGSGFTNVQVLKGGLDALKRYKV